MGSWSVYCGLSNISITAGHKCVLLLLKKNERWESYMKYIPATLPIFGEYDDYGGIENIEENENTKFIENHFNCTIQDFCNFFTDHNNVSDDLENNKEISKWKYMFIDRNVYDFLSTHNSEIGHNHPFGNSELLKKIGAEYIGEFKERDSRYCHFWNINGVEFKSDGEWLNKIGKHKDGTEFDSSIYDLSSIKKLLSEESIKLLEKHQYRLWNIYDEEYQAKLYFWIIGIDGSTYGMNKFLNKLKKENPDLDLKLYKTEGEDGTIADKYTENFKIFGDYFADLLIIRNNISCYSKAFEPFVHYLTPQCGEFKYHQDILNNFSKINKSYLKD